MQNHNKKIICLFVNSALCTDPNLALNFHQTSARIQTRDTATSIGVGDGGGTGHPAWNKFGQIWKYLGTCEIICVLNLGKDLFFATFILEKKGEIFSTFKKTLDWTFGQIHRALPPTKNCFSLLRLLLLATGVLEGN